MIFDGVLMLEVKNIKFIRKLVINIQSIVRPSKGKTPQISLPRYYCKATENSMYRALPEMEN